MCALSLASPDPEWFRKDLNQLHSLTFDEMKPVLGGANWSEFLPDVLKNPKMRDASRPIRALGDLVSHGPAAIAPLLDHLSDKEKTRFIVKILSRGLEDQPPETRADEGNAYEGFDVFPTREPTATVGDICLFAVGQIVNRKYSPSWSIDPPGVFQASYRTLGSLDPRTIDYVRNKWRGIGSAGLLQSLTVDVLRADTHLRDATAIRRILKYFPSVLRELAIQRLRAPIAAGDPLRAPVVRADETQNPGKIDGEQLRQVAHSLWDVFDPEIDKEFIRINKTQHGPPPERATFIDIYLRRQHKASLWSAPDLLNY